MTPTESTLRHAVTCLREAGYPMAADNLEQIVPSVLRQEQRLAAAEAREKHADKLAYEVARAILNREHGERSAVSDSLLNYLNVGGIDGPETVPEWMDEYMSRQCDEVFNVPFKFWVCPDHQRNGRVEWSGNVATCLECGRTNEAAKGGRDE